MSIAEKLTQVADNQQRVFDAGAQLAREECKAKHYVMEFTGDGTDSVTFQCPFEPDAVIVLGFDPFAYFKTGGIMSLTFDMSAFGRRGCSYFTTPDRGSVGSPKGAKNLIAKSGENQYTISGIVVGSTTGIFFSGSKYQVIAVKYTDKTDKQRITEFIESLPSGGTDSITLYADKVNAAFSETEWSALIATKPTYTFVMW